MSESRRVSEWRPNANRKGERVLPALLQPVGLLDILCLRTLYSGEKQLLSSEQTACGLFLSLCSMLFQTWGPIDYQEKEKEKKHLSIM